MKTNRFLLLTATLLLMCLHGPAWGQTCLAEHLYNLSVKHAQLHKWLYDVQDAAKSRILTKNRWKDKDFPLGEAQADLQASVARSHEISMSVGGPGEETVKAQLEIFMHDRVCELDKTSLVEAGEGIGHLVKYPTFVNKDAALANIIIKSQLGFKHKTLEKLKYTEAEFYRDWKVLLETSAPAIGPKMWMDGKLNSKTESVAAGGIAEVAAAARLKKNGAQVLEIGSDEIGTFPDGSKVDILTSTEMFQIGINGMTIKNKVVDDLTKTALGIKKALDSPSAQGKRFKFAHFDNDWSPQQSTIDQLNAELNLLYAVSASTPPQIFIASDFVSLFLD